MYVCVCMCVCMYMCIYTIYVHTYVSEERGRVESDLGRRLEEASSRAATAERRVEELDQECKSLATTGKALEEQRETSDSQLQGERREAKELREQQKQLELQRFQHEREIGELKVQLSAVREHLAAKEQLVSNQTSQADQATAQRKGMEEMLSQLRQQNQALEERFALSVKEIARPGPRAS